MDELRKRLMARAGEFYQCFCDKPDCPICEGRGLMANALRGFADAAKATEEALNLLGRPKVSTSAPKPV